MAEQTQRPTLEIRPPDELVPVPRPDVPPWWEQWECLRTVPVSGRYEGSEVTAGIKSSRKVLDLRVDIDQRYPNSPIMNRVSGDVYQVYSFGVPGRRPLTWRVYRYSWIIDRPVVDRKKCEVVITGRVRYWKPGHPSTRARIVIPWRQLTQVGPAEVTLTTSTGDSETFRCDRKSDCFRSMTLEVDVCQSVNSAPILPTYNTLAHNTRPADLPLRVLTFEEAYREAGIEVTIRPEHTIIDDSDPEFDRWSVSELHDAMETHFSQFAGRWPKWQMWGILAGRFQDSPGFSTAGIMFDYSGAHEPPERQGFAIFREHSWFDDLVDGTPTTQAQAAAMRQYLYTWVHEAGHAFNFLHSWDKGRPDALSWMNYDWRYDDRNGTDSFWSNFEFRFDDEELIHLRHGDRSSVIMGGDPWASGGHLGMPIEAGIEVDGEGPMELLVRSKGYFEFLEPITIEVRARNLMPDQPLDVEARLHPELGNLMLFIRKPNGETLQYVPIVCKVGESEKRTLKPTAEAVEGEDRYSENLFVSFGHDGFYFDEPGEYLVKAIYMGAGGLLIPSNTHRLRIGAPADRNLDRVAQDFFSYEVGMALYLQGSQSPYLQKGMELLQTIAEERANTLLGARVARMIAPSIAQPFFRIQEQKIVKVHEPDPQQALALTDRALKTYRQEKSKALNIEYHELVQSRVAMMVQIGGTAQAKREVRALRRDLTARGVNPPVLEQIKRVEESL
ncbi:MAG: hypothetical protein Kow0047_24750 [Anaerolineae bacterium]